MSNFDPQTFAQMTISDANATESVVVPVGEYPATIKDKTISTWKAKDGSSEGLKMFVMWEIEDPSVTEITGRAKNLVKQEMMFDLTDSGALATGKGVNVRLGRLREAVGLNTPGQPFSFDMLPGRSARVLVSHRPDGRDANIIYAEVKDVTKA